MLVTHEWLVKVVEKSSTINERLGDDFWYNNNADSSFDVIQSQIAKWRQLIAEDNQTKFEKRLLWDNLDLNTIGKVISCTSLVDEHKLPAWTETLKAALSASNLVSRANIEKEISTNSYLLDSENLLPFEEIFLPFIYVARQKLASKVNCVDYSILSAKSQVQLERGLLESLTELCQQTLTIEFHIFQTYKRPSLISYLSKLQNSNSREQYNNFVEKMLSGGLLDFFAEYSVLARIVATVTDYWVNNTSEFIHRLAADRFDIQTTFQNNNSLGEVVDIQPALSDRHNNGRSVWAITFASGLKLIYKPKDLGLEETFFELIAILNQKGIPLDLKVLKIINRFQYGWVEFVEYTPLQDLESAVRYYKRSGMLLCLLYALSGADFHQENIIACGDQPVAIDLEMLLSAIVRPQDSPDMQDASSLVNLQLNHSVISTSFLPRWEIGRNGEVYDMSALGGVEGQQTSQTVMIWQNVNTDGMVLSNERVDIEASHNIPVLNSVSLSVSDYVEELVDGFSQMYHFLMTSKEALLIDRPFTKFQKQQVRTIYRPTQVYASLVQEAVQPKNLRDGADLSIALDVLCKAFLDFEHKPHHWEIVAAEKQALTHLDIPFFVTSSDSSDLQINSYQSIEGYFIEPSYKLVVNRWHQLSKDDLEQQIGYIRTSVYAYTASSVKPIPLSIRVENEGKYPCKENLVDQAVKIAQEMQLRAIRAANGSVCWMGIDYLPLSGQMQPKVMGYDFYDGSSGVALFLAALTKATDIQEFRDLANASLQPIDHLLHNSVVRRQKIIRQIGIGGGKGIGSIIYTLVRCSQFLEQPQILNYAKQLVELISPEDIYRDQKFDVISGAAGCILGLLTLYNATGNLLALKLAKVCGDHLVNSRVTSSTGYLTWATLNGKLLTGISHGAAGIAYALLRLHAVINDSAYRKAAREAITYERSVYSPQAKNWYDLRSETAFSITWCNGAPGIGLARLGCLDCLDISDSEEIHNDIKNALETTQKYGLHNLDHLCCGNFGRIETLLVAAQTSKFSSSVLQSQLQEIIQKQVAILIENASKTGSFQIFPGYQNLYNPGFFQGTAGIGYELLRLAYPEMFPSALLWN